MSIDEWMEKMCEMYILWNAIQPKKDEQPAICDNTDEPRGHYAKRQRKTNTVWSHFYVESKKTELIEIENNIVIARGEVWGPGENGWKWSKDTNFQT